MKIHDVWELNSKILSEIKLEKFREHIIVRKCMGNVCAKYTYEKFMAIIYWMFLDSYNLINEYKETNAGFSKTKLFEIISLYSLSMML